MARPSETACTRANFTDNTGCLSNFTPNQRLALAIYFGVLELAALGGTDYRLQMGPDGTLATDSACDATLDMNQLQLASLLIAQNNADDAGATIPATNDLLATAIQCLDNQPLGMLQAMLLNVTCQLGRHAAYPQSDL